MAAHVDEAQVRHIAKLARLELTPDEVEHFRGQLAEILTYVQQLDEVDVSGVEPMAHPLPVTNVLRPDEPRPGLSTAAALANAPQRHEQFFKVPAVLDGGAGA